MNAEPLVVATRESSVEPGAAIDPRTIENVHFGSIAVVSVDGQVLHVAGDPQWPTFTRSTLKPFQALPFVREGGPDRYGWDARHVALSCASHSGEDVHVDGVAAMLASIDCGPERLQCGCHVPGWYAALGKTPPPDARWSPIQHNCSGKHTAFLAACRLHGEPLETYLDPASAVQRRVGAALAALAGVDEAALVRGTDGCSAPNYAMPLATLAHLYAQLAQGRAAPRDGDVLETLFDAMTTHPDLVSGTRRSDRALMALAPGDWVTKIGADGVQAIGIRSAGIGIAIKIADGSRDALYRVVVETLRQLDLVAVDEAPGGVRDERFAPWLKTDYRNARGTVTGRLAPVFALRST